jgi:rubrerythrin
MFTSHEKPEKCPSCGSGKVAQILWGYPAYDEEMEKDLEAGRIILGGCVVSGNDPSWQCVKCGVKIYKESRKNKEG